MKKQLFILAGILSCLFSFAQIVNIPDANFKAYLVGNPAINTNGDNEIQVSEASSFTGEIDCSNKNIADLRGIEVFVSLTGLDCENNKINALDVSENINLITLNCGQNNISSLDITNNINLETLICANNNLTTLDFNLNYDPKPKLKYLDCSYNKLTSIHLDDRSYELEYLNCSSNIITSINIYYIFPSKLKTLFCNENKLTDLNTMNAIALQKLNCSFNQLESLIIHWNNIEWVYCNDNQLEWFIDRYNNYPTLTRFVGHNNKFKSLDFSYSPNVSLINVEK